MDERKSILSLFLFSLYISSVLSIPQQIFIPGLNVASSSSVSKPEEPKAKSKSGDLNSLAYRLNENQLNDLFNLLNSNSNSGKSYFKNPLAKHEAQIAERNGVKKQVSPKADLLQQHNDDIEKYFKGASDEVDVEPVTTTEASTTTTAKSTTVATTTTSTTTRAREIPTTTRKPAVAILPQAQRQSAQAMQQLSMFRNSQQPQFAYGSLNKHIPQLRKSNNQPQASYGTIESVPLNDCSLIRDSRRPDPNYCNMYHLCASGRYQALLCPESYLYSTQTMKCEHRSKVDCATRSALDFDRSNVPDMDFTVNDYYNAARTPTIINGTLECVLGSDGYFADPEFCNIYHHCLAGVDYAEQCPHQLVWNDQKKMCDWQTKVNCTGHIIPVASGQTTFCSDKPDNKYADAMYCNVFHHCVGGIDNVVRCEEELQWNDRTKECAWERDVKCAGKMLPSEKQYNSTFCIGIPDGPYAHEEYCNVYHVCESGTDNIRQCPNQLFWDFKTKRCDWSGNVECTGRTLVTLSTDATLFCMERLDGVYGDTTYCNVYHNCLSGVDFKTKCPVGLIWNETKKDCDWSDTTQCTTGNFLQEDTDSGMTTFCADKVNGKYPHDIHCNRYYVCQNGKDIVFTCQNNLRYNATKQECDWAVNVQCFGKEDYMWEGIKDNFCKSKPDGNYPDPVYCNIFHQCQAATDYPKRCSNRLMFHEEKGECDWEDQVDCSGKEKLIETSGLEDESRPEVSGDGKGRVTKFCMTKENGNYADLFYCNVYHNCHGGFDTVQYCANGLVWRQDTPESGTCDWPMTGSSRGGVDCGAKQIFLIEHQSQVDIMATLRSEFCITRGEGLFAHTKYCDLYIHCTAQAVAITMECAPGLIFSEKRRECDYLSEDDLKSADNSYCPFPKQVLRPKPKADGTLMFNGNDVTGKFPTSFTCEQKSQQLMHNDTDWCNIYHVCAGPRDNIFICPPGTVFNKEKQGCFDRYTAELCSGSVNYYKPAKSHAPVQTQPQASNGYVPQRDHRYEQADNGGFAFGNYANNGRY